MTALSIRRTVAGVLDSADSTHLTVTSSTGSVVVSNVLVAPTSEGVYSYDTTFLTAGNYTATWTFSVSGQPDDIVSRVFEADSAVNLVQGVTLADIERRLARYVGPYYRYKGGNTSTTQQVYIPRLKTRIDRGGIEDLFILRRGVLWDGSLITNFTDDDRYRAVEAYTNTTGLLTPDQDWTLAPLNNEAIELHYLDPEQELRPIVQDGLRRCFFWDRLTTESLAAYRTINLTDSFPWLDSVSLIANLESAIVGSRVPPTNVMWWKPYYTGGSVYVNTEWLGPGSLFIDVLRPHSSLVNNEMSLQGPNSDNDVLRVDLEYAALSAWVQAWIQLTDRLTASAAQGNRLTSQMVADAFSKRSLGVANQQPELFSIRFESTEMWTQVGNAAEDIA